MPTFGNPVVGYIRPPGSPVIVGSFRVTATFAEHVASGRGPGIDIGNGRCGDPIFALHSGLVTFAGLIGAAKVVRIDFTDGIHQSGYAHLDTINVKVGQRVTRGQMIGTLGMTGADACHLHLGMKKSGVEVDSWPMLEQVQQEGEHIATATKNLQADITGKNARLVSIAKIATG